MACACVSAGKSKCPWCKEAEVHNYATKDHNCQYGACVFPTK